MSSPSKRKKNLRDKKIAVAVYHYVHHTTDLSALADTVNVDVETLKEWQKTPKWNGEMNFYASDNNVLCDKLGLDQIPDTPEGEIDGSLTTFAWVWGNIFQEGIDITEIDDLNRIGGHKMNSEKKITIKQIGIENVFQRTFRLLRIAKRNLQTIFSTLF